MRAKGFETQVILAGHQPPKSGATPAAPPVVPSVGYLYPSMAEIDEALGGSGPIYARSGSPTPARFEEAVAALEGAPQAVAFSSGMAAIHAALLAAVPPGGTVVAAQQLYGTTRALLSWMETAMGVTVHYADFLDAAHAQQTIRQVAPNAVMCEVLTNPLVRVVRLDQVAVAAQEVGAAVVVDNTFATPYLLRPLEVGAALAVHSATKFINGHGDVLGGVVAGSPPLIDAVYRHRKLLGSNLGSFEAWLALRGMRTLALRMRQACANAQQIAEVLAEHPRVSRVYYPGLPTDPCHDDAAALLPEGEYGAMLAFEVVEATRAQVFALVDRLQVIQPVTSLGDLHTLISHPATASHRPLTPTQRAEIGIREGTLRLSVGIEAAEDIITDLHQALGE